jgi:hypothetical protein
MYHNQAQHDITPRDHHHGSVLIFRDLLMHFYILKVHACTKLQTTRRTQQLKTPDDISIDTSENTWSEHYEEFLLQSIEVIM